MNTRIRGRKEEEAEEEAKNGGENILYMFIYLQDELMENATAVLIPPLFCRRRLQLREAVRGVRL